MADYNYKDKSKEFGETVRIDTINEEMRKRGECKPSLENEYVREQRDDYPGRRPQGRKDRRDNFFGSGILRLSIIGGVVVFVFIFAVMFLSQSSWLSGEKTADTEANATDIAQDINQNEGVYAIILNADNNRTVRFYSIKDKKHLSLTVNSETILTGSNGGSMNYSSLKAGDVVVVSERENTGNAEKILVPEDVWRKENITEVTVDTSANTVEYGDVIYGYGDDTFFVADGNSVYPGDISKMDTVTLIGKNSILFVARVEKSHGHLVFKNLDKIESAIITIDEKVVDMENTNDMIEVAQGEHKIVVAGTNIEDYVINVVVNRNDSTVIDINEKEIAEKLDTGVIKLNVSPSGYTVLLDGVPYLQSTTEILATKGVHKIEIVKPGYEKAAVDVTIEDKTIAVNMDLKELKKPEVKAEVSEGNVSVYSTPGWAKVYIDGEYIGIAPVMAKLSYGEHHIRAELEGYDEFKTHVTVNSPDKAITAKFE